MKNKTTTLAHLEEYNRRYTHGVQKGYLLQHRLDEHINFKRGNVLYLYAPPACGKTEIYYWISMRLAKLHGLTFHLHTPESDGNAAVMSKLTQYYCNGKFDTTSFGITEEQKKEAVKFIANHFYITCGQMVYDDILIDFQRNGCDFVSLDPWKSIIHERKGLPYDQYLDKKLPKFFELMQKLKTHGTIMNHPAKPEKIQIELSNGEKEMWSPPMTPYDLAEGQAWYRHGRNMVGLWRPYSKIIEGKRVTQLNPDGVPYNEGDAFFYMDKRKPEEAGMEGVVKLNFDWRQFKYE